MGKEGGSGALSQSARAAITKYHRLGAGKSKIKVLVYLILGEGL